MLNVFSYRTLRGVIVLGVVSIGSVAVAESRGDRRMISGADAPLPRYVYFGNGAYLLPDYGTQEAREPYALTGRREDSRLNDLSRAGSFVNTGQGRVSLPQTRE